MFKHLCTFRGRKAYKMIIYLHYIYLYISHCKKVKHEFKLDEYKNRKIDCPVSITGQHSHTSIGAYSSTLANTETSFDESKFCPQEGM